MKKKILLAVIIVFLIIACTVFISDGLTYLVYSLMALVVMSVIRSNRSWVMKLTRWGKANPRKAQVLIAVLQLAVMTLGITAGYNFKELGYELSNTTALVFTTIIVICFLSVPFLPKRSTIAIPKEVNKHRAAFIGIALSSFVMMVWFGNRMTDLYPHSPMTHAVKAFDHAVFPANSNEDAYLNDVASAPANNENYDQVWTDETADVVVFASVTSRDKDTKVEKKENRLEKKKRKMLNRIEKYRLAYGAGTVLLVVLIVLVLVPFLCAGICIMAFAISGEIAAGYILLGAAITGGSIWAMVKSIKAINKRKNKPSP